MSNRRTGIAGSLDEELVDAVRLLEEQMRAIQSGRANTFPGVRRVSDTVGDGVTLSFVVTHGLGTRDVVVAVYRNGSPWDEVFVGVSRTSADTVTVTFSVAPTADEYVVAVHG